MSRQAPALAVYIEVTNDIGSVSPLNMTSVVGFVMPCPSDTPPMVGELHSCYFDAGSSAWVLRVSISS